MIERRAFVVVLDGLGIGPAHDQAAYGDLGSNTLGNVLRLVEGRARSERSRFKHLEALGLGNCARLPLVPPALEPQAAYGTAQPASPGKDSTTGHWELMGLVLDEPFPTFPNGFPQGLIDRFEAETGRAVLGNRPASGTTILAELGPEHQRTGAWIVYTSADSVFQIAAHEDQVSVADLYLACEAARALCVGDWGVSRVIARPFHGEPGGYARTAARKDFSIPPTGLTLLDVLAGAGVPRVGVGKVDDLFAGRGIFSTHVPTNAQAYARIRREMNRLSRGFVLANVIEFDQSWGHRNDLEGFVEGLVELDRELPALLTGARSDDLVIFTADHGNDPTTPSTDHSRERVPVLAFGPKVKPVALGERRTFADIGQTVAEFFGVGPLGAGESFLGAVWSG